MAVPGKRYAAFAVDLLAVLLLFFVVAVSADFVGTDLARWDIFALLLFAYQASFLALRDGLTFGKYAQNISVVSVSGTPLRLWQSVVRSGIRAAPLALLEGNSDSALIGSLLLLALVVADTRLIERNPKRQSFTDRLAHSLVVDLPPPQPHRAPAGPMFSSSDAEFGVPPRRKRPQRDDA